MCNKQEKGKTLCQALQLAEAACSPLAASTSTTECIRCPISTAYARLPSSVCDVPKLLCYSQHVWQHVPDISCAEADDERLSSLASPAGLVTNEANAHAHLQDGRQATAQQPSRDALDQHPCRQSRSSASVHCSHLNAAHACAARPGENWLHTFMSTYALPRVSG